MVTNDDGVGDAGNRGGESGFFNDYKNDDDDNGTCSG